MAFATSLSLITNDNAPKTERNPRLRFSPIVDLANGKETGFAAQTDIAYEEYAFFGFARGENFACPANWLGKLVERTGRMAAMRDLAGRPLSICAPAAALAHPDAGMAAEAGAARANICPQEIRLEFVDLAVAEEDYSALEHLISFHRRGFRLGLDARASWETPLDSDLRQLTEAVLVDAQKIGEMSIPAKRLENAVLSGIQVVADNMRWRDAAKLHQLGVTHGIAPKIDG